MEDLIARIVAVETQCAEAISKAEQESKDKIVSHARLLEERKASEFAAITQAASEKLTRSIEETRKQVEAEVKTARDADERICQDKSLHEAIKQEIVSVLLSA